MATNTDKRMTVDCMVITEDGSVGIGPDPRFKQIEENGEIVDIFEYAREILIKHLASLTDADVSIMEKGVLKNQKKSLIEAIHILSTFN